MDHDSRMVVAGRVTEFVRARHPDTIAVAVYGSTAKAEDRAWSDVEMIAITRLATDLRGYGGVHEGIVVEVGLTTEEDAVREASRVSPSWPIEADGWVHTVPTYDPEGLFPRLAAIAANPDPEKAASAARLALVSAYEDLCKMRNFHDAGDRAMVRFMAPALAAGGIARFLGLINRQHYNSVRNLLTKPRDFGHLPPHFWQDVPRLMTAEGTPGALLRRAERAFRECRDLLLATGQEWPENLSVEEALVRGAAPR